MGGSSPGIPSKVTWQPSAGCWAVHYKQGPQTKVSRVRIKAADSQQKSLFAARKPKPDAEKMASLREEAFLEACRLWNELDNSKRPRIDLSDSGTR